MYIQALIRIRNITTIHTYIHIYAYKYDIRETVEYTSIHKTYIYSHRKYIHTYIQYIHINAMNVHTWAGWQCF